MTVEKTKKILVIGAGLGGISAAISCANRGYHVTVLEKNDKIGGKLNIQTINGFSFDLGPSILTLPTMFERLFSEAGKKMHDYFDIIALDIHWRNFFEDHPVIDLYADMDKTAHHLDEIQKGSGKEFTKFMEYSKRQYDIIKQCYFDKATDTPIQMLLRHNWLDLIAKLDIFRSMHKGTHSFFTNKYMIDVFDFFIKYVGSSAYNAPGFMNLMPYVQFGYGLWYAKGGMYNIAKGFARLMEELGITLRTNTEIVQVKTEHDRVTDIITKEGETFACDILVSNMEVVPAYKRLFNKGYSFLKRYRKFEPACSGLVMHLGVDKIYSQLAHHNFFFSGNQKVHFSSVFNKHELPKDPTLYVVAPVRSDNSIAPEGCDVIKVLPHIPHLLGGRSYTHNDYLALGERVLDKLERMGLNDLRKHIVVKDILTPCDIEKMYYSNGGSIYGVVSDHKKNFAFKCPKKSPHYKNCFFVGGSVNPGGGMPMVLQSGYSAAQIIKKQF